MNLLDNLTAPAQQWLDSLQQREKTIVIGGAIALIFILFYLLVWEPITSNHEQQQLKLESQSQLYSWMKNASNEITSIKAAGGSLTSRFKNQSTSSLADRSARTTGVKPFITKIEQSKKGVKVILKSASFDLIINWLSDMESKYGISSSNIKVERAKAPGAVDAYITLERSS